jgi:hypothetical protein
MRVILFLLKLVKRVMPQGTLTVTVKKGLPIEAICPRIPSAGGDPN